MKKILLIFILLLNGCLSNHQKAQPGFYSYIMGNVNDNRIDLKYNENVFVTPASCQKIITALLSLKFLGPDYRYETKLYMNKNNEAIIYFSGDPTLTSEKLEKLLEPLKNLNISKIILDISAFKTPAHSKNIMLEDMGTYYGQPIFAGNLDRNIIDIVIKPAKVNEFALLTNDLGYDIKSNIITSTEKSNLDIYPELDKFKATGNINVNDPEVKFQISPVNADDYLIRKISKLLSKINVKTEIEIEHKKRPLENLILIKKIHSEKLADFLIPAMKQSDNLIFDSLYLTIAHLKNPNISDWNEGDIIIKNMIKDYYDIDISDSRIVDGSGLSRYNRIEAKKLYDILKKNYHELNFINILPYPGEENSTLKRMNFLPENIKAKTGSMTGIRCLCGYKIDKSNPKVFIFTVKDFGPKLKEDIYNILSEILN